MANTALIVGAGSGLSASIARLLAKEGYQIALAARRIEKLTQLTSEIAAVSFAADASKPEEVNQLFIDVENKLSTPTVVVYNPSFRVRGPLIDLDPGEVAKTLEVSAYGGFLVAQAAAKRMLQQGSGAIFFTGASASIKGYPQSAPFAMGKFALRGLAQSIARELAPKNIHVAHFVIDGAIRSAERLDPADNPDSTLDPDAIAQTYLNILNQPRSAWTWEVELRPWVERF
ncbi:MULTISPECIES: SDR family NAD(P)-dependent oxidoreductase [unclassified Tolypothrix]|uniref:SDR family NAD(P)-dependent oxidoreductase n=1 Tax=unclassified Tolypothrix TaxID=2649714 RepID=UPI0005EAB9B9|nr:MULTISPECIES: SDR family NAD(P)-dependent oxidoreductase [unclassified Tolypothrix]BAY88750.1 short-chain dehydrogenase/reductase SDR [Microchaete diplosiphon NIES-3275]EKF01634.1 oxidoreductase, short chain dehydrogenase/reductase family protein [Tolypothrix sp. PCC 7601]MBE9088121.1 SDR family NAD(P)-dependent oxidoreductase [Tolypothrix sp. LEGE 11397]UYD29411.1 SDR family NAD(P)-dependent oxidoreductase [Tolypothrix sp. PCC 7712]UYD34681.1 SDR family NAD(P)-dependent oxidoreductase [Tol